MMLPPDLPPGPFGHRRLVRFYDAKGQLAYAEIGMVVPSGPGVWTIQLPGVCPRIPEGGRCESVELEAKGA